MFDVSTAPEESIVKLQKLFPKPVRIVKKYPVTEGGVLKKKHMVCLNWLISDEPLDMESKLALLFLDHLLLGSLNSESAVLEEGLSMNYFRPNLV